MSDEAGRFTAEHTVMDKNLEIREQTHLLEVRDKRIDDLLKENQHLESDNKELRVQLEDCQRCKASDGDVDYADESEDNFTEQLSFKFNQE
jgi:arginyl-tRNA--protein-N-Asp/Glu arginylyltransferase